MGNANTSRTGHSKIFNGHPIHCVVDDADYKKFKRWCVENGTTPTTHLRTLIREHNLKHSKEST